MTAIASYIPGEFGRRPRSFVKLDRWKATEFRYFLLYIEIYVLKNVLSKKKYRHFLLLVFSMRTICSRNNKYVNKFGIAAIKSIKTFCTNFGEVYGQDIEPVFNTHSVSHLIEDSLYRKEIPKDSNCFTFENYLGQIKKIIRAANKPLTFFFYCKKKCSAHYEKADDDDDGF